METRFIRKNGRIIPIKGKKKDKKEKKKPMSLAKVDALTGAAAGAGTVGFIKSPKVSSVFAGASLASGAYTAYKRFYDPNRTIGDKIKDEIGGSLAKSFSGLAGGALAGIALFKYNKGKAIKDSLKKASKAAARRAAKKSKGNSQVLGRLMLER
jgi:hypothetical protein